MLIVYSHGKIGFADLARKIAAKWKALTKEEREPFDTQAAAEKKRYAKELKVWKKEQEAAKQAMRREHEMLVQARTGLVGRGLANSGMGIDAAAAAAGFRDSASSGLLQLPANAALNRNSVQAFDEFSGNIQHPYQQLDPAMLSSNTAPSVLDTSNSAWSASNQAYQQAQQRAILAQERQRAFDQSAFSGMSSNIMTNNMAGMRSGMLGLGGQDFSNQFNMGSNNFNQASLMGSLSSSSGMNTMRQLSGLNDAASFGLSGQGGASSFAQQAAGGRYGAMGMGNQFGASLGQQDQLAAARMGLMDSPGGFGASARWNSSYATSGDLASQAASASSALFGSQQQGAGSRGTQSSQDEMARFMRNQFGA